MTAREQALAAALREIREIVGVMHWDMDEACRSFDAIDSIAERALAAEQEGFQP